MIRCCPLPFYDERSSGIDMLVIHSMAYAAEAGIARLRECKLSSHYVVDYDGTIYQCVGEDKRAWHAGVAYWRGIEDVNSHAVGIEVCHRSLGQDKFNKRQIGALIPLCRDIIERHRIVPQMVVGHSDIAPQRKPDPGKEFPWAELAAHDVGIWYGSRFADENDVAAMLAEIGYDAATPAKTGAAAYAFCRRFLPAKVGKLPVKKVIAAPCPANNADLLDDPEFVRVLQNITLQYRLYQQASPQPAL